MTLPSHHPPHALLRDYALGALDPSHEVLVATHLSLCPACRARAVDVEAVAGAVLAASEDVPVADAFMDALLARFDATPDAPEAVRRHDRAGVLPAPLVEHVGDLDALKWRWRGPGVWQVDVLARREGLPLRLVRLRSGSRVPLHDHTSDERAVLLDGGWTDHIGHFGRGDYAFTAHDTQGHAQRIDAGRDCIALVLNDTPIVPQNPLIRWISTRLAL